MNKLDQHKEKAIQILRNDPVLKRLLEQHELPSPVVENDIYRVLLHSIVSQQLSTKAASTIWNRFLSLFPKKYPSPEILIELDEEKLRTSGLSRQKASYLKAIAGEALEGNLKDEVVFAMDDKSVHEHLTRIKGVGPWTVEMIMIFALGKMDVFPASDLGIQIAMKELYSINKERKALIRQMQSIAEDWRPYRSYASLLLWEFKDQR